MISISAAMSRAATMKCLRWSPWDPGSPPVRYGFTIACIRGAIRVYLDKEDSPRIVVRDPHYRLKGSALLGGGWIPTEYSGVAVRSLSRREQERYLKDTVQQVVSLSPKHREKRRVHQRAAYAPVLVGRFADGRTDLSLNGRWLFRPGYEVQRGEDPADPHRSDAGWHVMDVPHFWNPVRNWLHLQESGLPHGGSGVSDNYREQEEQRCDSSTFDHRRTTDAWYRHWIVLPQETAGKRLVVTLTLLRWPQRCRSMACVRGNVGMFGSFDVDLTEHVRPGKNLLAVHVMAVEPDGSAEARRQVARAVSVDITNAMLHSLPHGMFGGTEGGIWQPVTLTITNPVHIDDVFAQVRTDGGDMHVTCVNLPAHP
ncbi:MAG: hypothetical protein IPI01_03635 [Ignavibacteriae bacterium]|nr:hypothetical protein [Ignavibacteriota bacterium]